ncbi:MAG: 3-deoxy-D-manno-octulosonic acid kinase [Burkholderiaceae bacterium]
MSDLVDARTLAFPDGAMRYDAQRIKDAGPLLFDPDSAGLQAEPVAQGGRQAAWFVRGEFGQAVLRRYRRGGLMAKLSDDRYLWTGAGGTRSFAEFELLRFMFEKGLPVPRPLAAAYWRSGPSYRAAILVERIAGVRTLAGMLDTASTAAVAMAVFTMHDAGVWHADLNAYNILVDPAGKVWLIDFDKGRRQALSAERRHANLLRLRRSLVKVAGNQGLQWWEGLSRDYGLLAAAKARI